jgi:hypothetical protein
MRNLHKLQKEGHILELMNVAFEKDKPCGACQVSKQVGAPHHTKNIMTTTRPLEMLHIDLFGPIIYISISGNKYGLVIVVLSSTIRPQDEDQDHDQEESNDQGGDKDDGDHERSRPKPPHPKVHQTIQRDHPVENILSDIKKGVTIRSRVAIFYQYYSFVSSLEPFNVEDALHDLYWVVAMQEELNNFKRNEV